MTTDEEVRCSFVVNLDKVLLAKQKVGIEKVFFFTGLAGQIHSLSSPWTSDEGLHSNSL